MKLTQLKVSFQVIFLHSHFSAMWTWQDLEDQGKERRPNYKLPHHLMQVLLSPLPKITCVEWQRSRTSPQSLGECRFPGKCEVRPTGQECRGPQKLKWQPLDSSNIFLVISQHPTIHLSETAWHFSSLSLLLWHPDKGLCSDQDKCWLWKRALPSKCFHSFKCHVPHSNYTCRPSTCIISFFSISSSKKKSQNR